jgi:hypothetical protein
MPTKAATFPGSLILPIVPDAKYPSQNGPWKTSHNRAVREFTVSGTGRPSEVGILSLFAGLDALARAGVAAREPFGVQHVWGPLIDGARDLLNFDLGRLDGGTLDAFLCDLSARVGRNSDTGEFVPSDADA